MSSLPTETRQPPAASRTRAIRLDPADDVTHRTLVLAYNGEDFMPITSPSPDQTSDLHGVAINAGMIWAVGTTGHGAHRSTLVLTNICNQ